MAQVNLDPINLLILTLIKDGKTIRQIREEIPGKKAISTVHRRIMQLEKYGLVKQEGNTQAMKRELTPIGEQVIDFKNRDMTPQEV